MDKLAQLSPISRMEGDSLILPFFEGESWFQMAITKIKSIAEVITAYSNEDLELTLLEDAVYHSMLDRVAMVLRGREIDYRLPKYHKVFGGVNKYHVHIRKTVFHERREISQFPYLVSMTDNYMRSVEATPTLKLTEVESFHGVNEETVILPYQPDFLFRQSNSRNPHLKLLFLFSCLDSERTAQIENTIKEFFKDNESANVYLLPSGIVVSDVFKSLLITY